MRHLGVGKWAVLLASVAAGLGAAPAAPNYYSVERMTREVRDSLAKPGRTGQPNAPGWYAFFDALSNELRNYATAQDETQRLTSLNRLYQMSTQLATIHWLPAQRVREELRAWLQPRIHLAWAERRLVDRVETLPTTPSPAVQANRRRWIDFVNGELARSLRLFDGAATVADRLDALKQVYGAITSLQARNQAVAWAPSLELQAALNRLYNGPNLDISADVATLAPVLGNDIVQTGPIERKGYVSQVTAGPRLGFGLMPSDEGITFYNSQIAYSVTPITDFYNQMQQDRRGRRAAKLYTFGATTYDTSTVTVVAVISPNGLSLGPQSSHSTDAAISSAKTQGHALGRGIASLVGFNQPKITQKVYEGAIGRIRQNVVQESAEEANEKSAQAAAEKNAQLRQYLRGNNTLVFRNLLIDGLSMRSRPENALIGGTLRWLNGPEQVGAYDPQPSQFAVPAPGVSADLHLSSIMTNLVRGYLQSGAVNNLENLMVVTRDVAPNAPPKDKVTVSRNVDYPGFLKAVNEARAANDPKVQAIRFKRPGQPPEFAADARGFLVAVVHDFQIEVPAPPQAAKGGFGPPAQVYRVTSPRAEFVISFKITPNTQNAPVRLSGRLEEFDPGPAAKVIAVNEREDQAEPLTAFTTVLVLNVFKNKLRGQPIDVPLSNLKLSGFAIRDVSPLDPSGWIRANLVRTSASPAAGIQ